MPEQHYGRNTEEVWKKYGITPKMIQDKFGKASGKIQERLFL